jgi:hypothetical protein
MFVKQTNKYQQRFSFICESVSNKMRLSIWFNVDHEKVIWNDKSKTEGIYKCLGMTKHVYSREIWLTEILFPHLASIFVTDPNGWEKEFTVPEFCPVPCYAFASWELSAIEQVTRENLPRLLKTCSETLDLNSSEISNFSFLLKLRMTRETDECFLCLNKSENYICPCCCFIKNEVIFRPCGHFVCLKCFEKMMESENVVLENKIGPFGLVPYDPITKKPHKNVTGISGFSCPVCRQKVCSTFTLGGLHCKLGKDLPMNIVNEWLDKLRMKIRFVPCVNFLF